LKYLPIVSFSSRKEFSFKNKDMLRGISGLAFVILVCLVLIRMNGSAMPTNYKDKYHTTLPRRLAIISYYPGKEIVELPFYEYQCPRARHIEPTLLDVSNEWMEKTLSVFETRFQEISEWLVETGRDADDIFYVLATNQIGAQTAIFVEFVTGYIQARYMDSNQKEVAYMKAYAPKKWERVLNIARRAWGLSQKLVYFKKRGERTIAGDILQRMAEEFWVDVAKSGQKQRKSIADIGEDLSWAWADPNVRMYLLRTQDNWETENPPLYMRFTRPEKEFLSGHFPLENSEPLSPPDTQRGVGLLEAFRKSPTEPLKETRNRIREYFAPPKSLPRLRIGI
jgi:hypothetical protein